MKILCVVGARPNFMKILPILEVMKEYRELQPILIHTGQHYDENMAGAFFRDLSLALPDHDLGVGSGSHSQQTAEVMTGFEKVCLEEQPDLVMVVGDVNSTLAAALVAAKLQIRVAHIEAGLRSRDWTMPEEINRVLTDRLSDLLFTHSVEAEPNLLDEGIAKDRIHLVGNVMIDTLVRLRGQAEASNIVDKLGLTETPYAVTTLHRPSNVDREQDLRRCLDGLSRVGQRIPVIFPVHPRTRKQLEALGLRQTAGEIRLVEPLGYVDFLALVQSSRMVLTDSGGLQEETTYLNIPCLTLRENTERPVTLTMGTSRLVGSDPDLIEASTAEVLAGKWRKGARPPLWDGRAAERIVEVLLAS